MGNLLINISGLSVGYEIRSKKHDILKDINLEINQGELVCVIGANGSGKSTFLRTISSLQPSLSGIITIRDRNIKDYSTPDLAKTLSVVLTESINAGNINVEDLVALGRYPYCSWSGKLSDEDINKINEAIEFVGISDLRHRAIYELSDGERQKAIIARAIAQDADIIILDEPTAFLDLPYRISVLLMLRKLAHEHNKAIILSTHDVELAIRTTDKMLVLNNSNWNYGATEKLITDNVIGDTFSSKHVSFNKETRTFDIIET